MRMPSNVYAVILAGGSGTRFWPKSRKKSPKQLCKIGDSQKTMIEITLDRLDGFVPEENRILITHKSQKASTQRIVGERCHKVIAEPEARQTAAALSFGAFCVEEVHAERDSEVMPIMISLHADHIIKKVDEFKDCLQRAVRLAEKDFLCLLGITPSRPETGFGYIEKGESITGSHGFHVKSFREKPDKETAEEFINRKDFFWNSGLFVWRTKKILDEIKLYLPATFNNFLDVKERLGTLSECSPEDIADNYSKLQSIAIDNGILEVSKDVAMVEADIDWQDVGTWSALDQSFRPDKDGNLIFTDAMTIDCQNIIVDGDGPLIATLGLKDMVIVGMKDAVLVAPKERSQEVKLFVERLKENQREDLI